MSETGQQSDRNQDDRDLSEHIAYEPTEAELEAARDDAVHADRFTVEPELGDAHTRVRERVEKIVDAAHQNGVLQTIDVEELRDTEYQSVSITIKPLENWNVEGQRGMDTAFIVLGAGGGVKIGEISSLFGERRYDDFGRLRRGVRMMD